MQRRKPARNPRQPARPIRNKQKELDSRKEEIDAEVERLEREIQEAPQRQAAEFEKRKREVMMRAVVERPVDARFHDDDLFDRPARPRRQVLKSEARAARQQFFLLLVALIVVALLLWGYFRS